MSYLHFAGVATKMDARFRDNTVAEADRWWAGVKTSCEAVARERAAVASSRGVIGFPACDQSLPQLVEITRNEGRMFFPCGSSTPMWSC